MPLLKIGMLCVVLIVLLCACQVPQESLEVASISGDFRSTISDHWFTPREFFGEVAVKEVDPISHEAEGFVSYHAYDIDLDAWSRLESTAESVIFDERRKTAIIMARVDHKTGWGDGAPGDYVCFWVSDDAEGDKMGVHYFSDFVSSETERMTWPADMLTTMNDLLPEVASSDPSLVIDVVYGDIEVILPG